MYLRANSRKAYALCFNPKPTQYELSAAIAPVADRLLKRYKAAKADLEAAQAKGDKNAEQEAANAIGALVMP